MQKSHQKTSSSFLKTKESEVKLHAIMPKPNVDEFGSVRRFMPFPVSEASNKIKLKRNSQLKQIIPIPI